MTRPDAGPVLLIGHDASRTGAPAAQLSLVRWARQHLDIELSLVLLSGGPLVAELESLVPCSVMHPRRSGSRLVESGVRSLGLAVSVPSPVDAVRLRRLPTSSVVVANSLVSLPVAAAVARRGRSRLVCHVHELDGVAARVLPSDVAERNRLLGSVDRFVAAGGPVSTMLVDRFGVPADRVRGVTEFIEDGRPDPVSVRRASERMGRDSGRPVVLSVGSLVRRKGPERFVDLMAALAEHPTRPLGVWLGGDPSGVVADELRRDVDRSGLTDDVVHIPSVHDPRSYIAAADVVVSTAIEDPYPLAVLEAGLCGVPVVGFDSGGLADVLAGCGESDNVVPLGDLRALCDRVRGLLEDPVQRSDSGRRLQDHVAASHLTDVVAPRVWDAVLT